MPSTIDDTMSDNLSDTSDILSDRLGRLCQLSLATSRADMMADDAVDDRWTMRGIPKPLREAVTAAAQRAKMSVGEWACDAFDQAIQAEREPFEVVAGPSDNVSDTSDTLSDNAALERIERTIAAAVLLAGAAEVPTGFRRAANRLLRASLPKAAPQVQAGRQPLRLAGGTEAA